MNETRGWLGRRLAARWQSARPTRARTGAFVRSRRVSARNAGPRQARLSLVYRSNPRSGLVRIVRHLHERATSIFAPRFFLSFRSFGSDGPAPSGEAANVRSGGERRRPVLIPIVHRGRTTRFETVSLAGKPAAERAPRILVESGRPSSATRRTRHTRESRSPRFVRLVTNALDRLREIRRERRLVLERMDERTKIVRSREARLLDLPVRRKKLRFSDAARPHVRERSRVEITPAPRSHRRPAKGRGRAALMRRVRPIVRDAHTQTRSHGKTTPDATSPVPLIGKSRADAPVEPRLAHPEPKRVPEAPLVYRPREARAPEPEPVERRPARPAPQATPPQIDIDRLSRDVIAKIEHRMRVELERTGRG